MPTVLRAQGTSSQLDFLGGPHVTLPTLFLPASLPSLRELSISPATGYKATHTVLPLHPQVRIASLVEAKEGLAHLELELQTVAKYHVDARN